MFSSSISKHPSGKTMTRSLLILCFVWVCVSVCLCKLEMHGHVHSPLYPKPYPANIRKQWNLEVPAGYRIQVTFNYLDIEPSPDCYYDSLMVLHDRKLLNTFCGQNSSDPHHPGHKPIMSPSNRLQLVFITDQTNTEIHQHLGFSVFYQAIDIDECTTSDPENLDSRCSQICLNTLGSYLCACHHGYQLRGDHRTCVLDCGGGIFKEPQGVISSPGFPNAAPFRMKCIYSISVQPGFQITLSFNDSFHIEHIPNQEPSCLYHWLQMSVPGQSPRKLCGDKSPGVINTHSHIVELEFHTDDAGQSRGFSLQYTSHRVECEINQTISNGQISPSFPKYYYRDYIHIRCDAGYKLMTEGNEIKSYMSMCTEDGTWHLPLPQCKIIDCGDPKPLLNGDVKFFSGFGNQYKSLIQYHCNEPYYTFHQAYAVNYTCAVDRKWRAVGDDSEVPHCYPVCGRPDVEFSGKSRVLGGEVAPQGAFPWQVFLKANGRGGAMVIGEKWILTAAHNLKKTKVTAENIELYVGHNNVLTLVKTPKLPVESFYIHPGYKDSEFDNDIALIKLSSSITFNGNVMPVCLPAPDDVLQRSGWVSGFGLNEDYRAVYQMMYIRLPTVDQQVCRESIDMTRKSRPDVSPLTENMFCAGVPEGGKDTCQGDSGSAFVMKNDGKFYATGIVSWGVDCGQPGKYGVYTRISRYVDWIKEIMQENQ